MKKNKEGERLFHLEYKWKEGAERHKYYAGLPQLVRFNPLINVKLSTLQHFDFNSGYYENETVIIYKGVRVNKNATPKLCEPCTYFKK